MYELIQGIGGGLNGHVGKDSGGIERFTGGLGYGVKNELGGAILDFATMYDLILTNTWFKKKESHLIPFKSGTNVRQINFIISRKGDSRYCKDCKVISGQSVTTQHRLVVLDICIRRWSRRDIRKRNPWIKWWGLKREKQDVFTDKMIKFR